jgi:hypothetical protein
MPEVLTDYYITAVSSTNKQINFLIGKKIWTTSNNIDKYSDFIFDRACNIN